MSELPDENRLLAAGTVLLGCVLLACAVMAADAAFEHMRALGVVCGRGAAPHCGWCLAALAFAGSGAAAVILGWRNARSFSRGW